MSPAFTTSAELIYQNATQRRTYAAMVAQMDDAVVSARSFAKDLDLIFDL